MVRSGTLPTHPEHYNRRAPRCTTLVAPTDESAWLEWADGEAACAIAQHKARLSGLQAPRAFSGAPFSERLWRQHKGQGAFFDQYFGRESATIASAIDPGTGRRSWDPNVYKDLVKRVVAKPFATRVTLADAGQGSSLCKGLCHPKTPDDDDIKHSGHCKTHGGLCYDIRCSGLPEWWESKYRTIPRAAAAFKGVFDDVTPEDVVTAIRGAKWSKSPGPDLLSIDLLKTLLESY